ncbi:hypothetical protein BU24DRAFT_422882 [Aaosphaeria arxii CBS 175.79]|uniref:Uncharacterized protein n=1 Tax=Aaosphaeria arxii CBS 175.79 TaxID=1450172 RepID=A0A6A5XUA3_9PLEO|nr:uncharacterized protein BU24DRAFT_422882 [Aaosphaeria arxii CBS 175.79]KAF2016533.1 hypothetical protein BU24DRAFT_422882 [Aaosphaeria arxii CBS 175.79]
MTAGLMRRLFSSSTRAQLSSRLASNHLTAPRLLGLKQYQRTLSNIRPREASVSKTWFTSTTVSLCSSNSDIRPPDERTLKLGRTIRMLHERLPELLVSPLPQDILSPHITLHLFPSTHPHLPTVRGKLAYTAALWTAPVAWGRVPVLGNVKLAILSERMVKNGGSCSPTHLRHEKLIVKWKTCGKSDTANKSVSGASGKVSSSSSVSGSHDEEFTGIFVFEFDEEGRIINHTIERAEENGNWDKTAKVISVTDWLLGRAWGKRGEEAVPSLAFVRSDCDRRPNRNDSGRGRHS